jgi:hypothetical protein
LALSPKRGFTCLATGNNRCGTLPTWQRETAADTAIDLWMLAALNGQVRTSSEISVLAESCGLWLKEVVQVAGNRTLLEFVPR